MNKEFRRVLNQRVARYLRDKGETRHGGATALLKASSLFLLVISLYVAVIGEWVQGWYAFICVLSFGIASASCAMNVAHDASHGSLSSASLVNKFFIYTWYLVGISPYTWRLRHNLAHHSFTNVLDHDLDIEVPPGLHLQKESRPEKYHAFQFLYAPLLYSVFTLYSIFIKDFQLAKITRFGSRNVGKIPGAKMFEMVLIKVIYVIFFLIVPILFTNYSISTILLCFLCMHVVTSWFVALALILPHLNTRAEFFVADSSEYNSLTWTERQLSVTSDFAPRSKIWFIATGGLNLHCAHHLYPNYSHTILSWPGKNDNLICLLKMITLRGHAL